MIRFNRSGVKWWQKPLVIYEGKPLPAELAILYHTLRPGESGAWLNSRGTKTGVTGFRELQDGKFKTTRTELPPIVRNCLKAFYSDPEISKGVYDLVIWNTGESQIRFVEVKCPHWDKLTLEQKRFAKHAARKKIMTSIAEWEFIDDSAT